MVRLGMGAGTGLALGLRPGTLGAQEAGITKTIPSTGEAIPPVGLGTANTFSRAARSPEEHDALREVVRLFTELGGRVIDTAPSYGASEEVVGELAREVGNAGEVFWATKISGVRGREAGLAQVERSEERLRPGTFWLNQVHNLGDWQTQLPLLRELKEAGRVRYVGITTSSDRQYEALERILRSETLDFVQFDYAIDNRGVEETLIPIARDRGIATMANLPFGRTRLFRRVGDRPVPGWAHEFGARTWAQFFLKWLLGNPAMTVVIPGTSDPEHLADNMGAGVGRLPDEGERRRMVEVVESLPAA